MKNFNYYRPKILVISILAIYAIIIVLFDAKTNHWSFNAELTKTLAIKIFSASGIIIAVFAFYNKWLWKWPLINKLIDFPILKGSYYGKLISTYKDENKNPIEKECIIDIYQNGTDIKIKSYYATDEEIEASSISESYSFALVKNEETGVEIAYTYKNTPLKPADKYAKLNAHEGTSILRWHKSDPTVIYIDYYNKERNSKGTIHLIKEFDKPQAKFYRP